MAYKILKILVRIALHWYIGSKRKINLSKAAYSSPSLVIANHPNSFFDALLIEVYSRETLYFLVRGDIFKHPLANKVLRSLHMLPIYKKNDVDDFVAANEVTFNECVDLLQSGRHVLIFPEGRSYNDWQLHPFRKGGMNKILEKAAEENIFPRIQPFIISYSSYKEVPKGITLQAYDPVKTESYFEEGNLKMIALMNDLYTGLKDEIKQPHQQQRYHSNFLLKALLFLPAVSGYISQYWYYKLWEKWVRKKTAGSIFFDSVMFGVVFVTYPFFVLFLSIIVGVFAGCGWGIVLLCLMPFTALCMAKTAKIKKANSHTNASL